MGAQFEAGDWYQALSKPSLTPPDWAFGPIWAVVYLLMAVAAWRVWSTGRSVRTGALAWWLIILALNVAWSWMMFELNRPGWVMGLSILLFGLSVMCARAFSLVTKPAGLMMVPAVVWLAFVVYLSFSFWSMNGGGLGGQQP